jgi:hypothetical protein
MGGSVKWFASPGVSATFAEDGVLLLDIKRGTCYRLNAVAARLWVTIEACPEGILTADIVDVLETHFEVTREVLERDAAECLDNLQGLGLVRGMRDALSSKAAPGRT